MDFSFFDLGNFSATSRQLPKIPKNSFQKCHKQIPGQNPFAKKRPRVSIISLHRASRCLSCVSSAQCGVEFVAAKTSLCANTSGLYLHAPVQSGDGSVVVPHTTWLACWSMIANTPNKIQVKDVSVLWSVLRVLTAAVCSGFLSPSSEESEMLGLCPTLVLF